MKNRSHLAVWTVMLFALPLLGGCFESETSTVDPVSEPGDLDGNPSGGDSDGDTDGDTDGDSDGDTDGDSDGDTDGDTDGDSDGDTDGDSGANSAPTISGTPANEALVGQQYSFTPNASDPDGDTLTFSITNKPTWANFNTGTGRLSGTPTAGTEGTYGDIGITVSDGSASASMPQFDIEVQQISMGSATLSWTPPTENTDDSPLNDLAAYKIYYGTSSGNYPNQIDIDNPGISTYVVENLPPDTYYFVSTAINSNGIESDFSNVATKVVN